MSPVIADARIFSPPNGREAWLYVDWIARDGRFKAIKLVFDNSDTKQIFSDEISTCGNCNFYLSTAIPIRKIFADVQHTVELSSVIIVVDDKKNSNEFSVRTKGSRRSQ